VSDPILLFLILDMAALLVLGACAALMPPAAGLFLTAGLAGLGAFLCLPPLFFSWPAAALNLPTGPPGLHLHLALDPLPAFFLLLAFLSGTAIAAFQGTTAAHSGSVRVAALCLAGTAMSLLAADGVTLTMGSALVCGTIVRDWRSRRTPAALLIPLLLLAAVCLLTPTGFTPRFDAIRAAPIGMGSAAAAAMMTIAAITGMICLRAPANDWTGQALIAGVVFPSGVYILIRLIADLSSQSMQPWWGAVLLTVGGWFAVVQAWRAAADADIDGAVAAMMRRQAGLMVMGVGLALIGRAADLPQAQSLALDATVLLAIGSSLAGTVATLAAEALGSSAATVRLSRLGGLVHTMPWASAALAAGLLALAALPPGIGFASVWLLFQSLLSAPRTGPLIDQLPLALAAAAIALSAAAAASASVRIIGVAMLGRPRTPRGAGAQDISPAGRVILSTLAGLSLIAGIIPGSALWALADSAVSGVTGSSPGIRGELTMLSVSAAFPGYAALPVIALLALATGCVILVLRWLRREGKVAGLWFGGMKPPVGLPFGEPMAQSAGAGFLPELPVVPLPPVPRFPSLPRIAAVSPTVSLWIVLIAFGLLLLILAVAGGSE
jgi:hydrogenase-4 component B